MKEPKNNENKKAVIYCRVSTKEQVEEGNSLSTQEKICRDYAFKNGYEVSQVFIEQGESAKTAERTELKKLFTFCASKKNGISAVIAYKIDRISRNTDDYSQIRILLKNYGVEIKSTSEYFENTPAGRFMENIIANVAQFDNDVRTERCMGGMLDACREGRYVWSAPVGYRNVKIAGKSTIEPDDKCELVKEAFQAVAKQIEPIEYVRQRMVKKGLCTKRGNPVVKSIFHSMLRNPVYKGLIVKFGEINKGMFEALISEELFDWVQRILKNPNRSKSFYQKEHPDFPLRRFVTDANTGYVLTGGWSRGKLGKYYAYYRCIRARRNYSKSYLENHYEDFISQFALSETVLENFKASMEKSFGIETKENRKEVESLKKSIDELLQKQNTLIDDRAKGYISGEVLKRQMPLIEDEVSRLQIALGELQEKDFDFLDVFNNVSEFLKNPYQAWENLSVSDKTILQGFEFPKGLTFDGKIFRTPEVCRIFKLKTQILNSKFYAVDSNIKNSNLALKTKDKIELKLALIETDKVLKSLKEVG